MGKNFEQGSKTQLRNIIQGLRSQLEMQKVSHRRSFMLLGALLNRAGRPLEFTRQELDELDMERRMDVEEKPEIDKYILRWEDQKGEKPKTNYTPESILGAKSGTSAG